MAEEISEQKLKDMELHDEIVFNERMSVNKVIGGWIYWRFGKNDVETSGSVNVSCALAGVFVPEP